MRSMLNKKPMQTPEGRKQDSPGRRRYAMAHPNLRTFHHLGAGRDVGLAESGLQPWERYMSGNRPERVTEPNSTFNVSRASSLATNLAELQDNVAMTHTQSDALSGRFCAARIPRAKALGYAVSALRACRNTQTLIYLPFLLSGCARVGVYAPSLDVYGSYFPAWLICLIIGVILTVLASQIGRLFDLSALRKFGPLIPISLILIFSIATWFLFFAS
jgi:hypothetical protein